MPVLLVRHAVALPRRSWDDDDAGRPLNDRGRRQAAELVNALDGFRVVRVSSSPAVRCVETVAPLAAARRLDVGQDDALFEGNGQLARSLVASLLDGRSPAAGRNGDAVVLCTHGDVIPEVLWTLQQEGASLGDDDRCQKGSTWVLERRARGGLRGRYLPPSA